MNMCLLHPHWGIRQAVCPYLQPQQLRHTLGAGWPHMGTRLHLGSQGFLSEILPTGTCEPPFGSFLGQECGFHPVQGAVVAPGVVYWTSQAGCRSEGLGKCLLRPAWQDLWVWKGRAVV